MNSANFAMKKVDQGSAKSVMHNAVASILKITLTSCEQKFTIKSIIRKAR